MVSEHIRVLRGTVKVRLWNDDIKELCTTLLRTAHFSTRKLGIEKIVENSYCPTRLGNRMDPIVLFPTGHVDWQSEGTLRTLPWKSNLGRLTEFCDRLNRTFSDSFWSSPAGTNRKIWIDSNFPGSGMWPTAGFSLVPHVLVHVLPCSAKLLTPLEHPKIAIDIYIPNQSPSKGSVRRYKLVLLYIQMTVVNINIYILGFQRVSKGCIDISIFHFQRG